MHVTYENNMFIWQGPFSLRYVPSDAGFEWNNKINAWCTECFETALKLSKLFNEIATRIYALRGESLDNSYAMTSGLIVPVPPEQKLYDYQRAGIEFALCRKDCIIADEMGLGKTAQAIGVINCTPEIKSILVVCPASLKINWQREMAQWLVDESKIGTPVDSKKKFGDLDSIIINYDILSKYKKELSREWDLVIFDEAQYCKSGKAKRTKAALSIPYKKRLFLTGTPILNRPIELFPILHAINPERWPNRMAYALRYCGARKRYFGKRIVWDVSGASNLPELRMSLRSSVMVRRKKIEVMKELPEKIRQVIELPSKEEDKLTSFIKSLKYENADSELKTTSQILFENISKVRHETTLDYLPQIISFLRDALESSEKIACFAHHRDVLEALREEFSDSVMLIGGMNPFQKQTAVDTFQTDKKCRLFVGSIKAAGVGYNLTAANHGIIVEGDWTPGVLSQVEDRLHRIGQTKPVLIQHLVPEGSIGAHMIRTAISKQKNIDAALDDNFEWTAEISAIINKPKENER